MAKSSKNPASDVGQKIGAAFEKAVIQRTQHYLELQHPAYELQSTKTHKTTLAMLGGLTRQIDTVIIPIESDDPIALLETKWLKDGRHHNDKGAWILQLREIRKNYPTIRGSVAILAGYWTAGVSVMLAKEGQVKMILVATDTEIYSTLQAPFNHFAPQEAFPLDAKVMRQSYPNPGLLVRFLNHLEATDQWQGIVESWFGFERQQDPSLTGGELIHQALDELLKPIQMPIGIQNIEITLQISAGNLIHETFSNIEEVQDFLSLYTSNPEMLLARITPKPRDDNTD